MEEKKKNYVQLKLNQISQTVTTQFLSRRLGWNHQLLFFKQVSKIYYLKEKYQCIEKSINFTYNFLGYDIKLVVSSEVDRVMGLNSRNAGTEGVSFLFSFFRSFLLPVFSQLGEKRSGNILCAGCALVVASLVLQKSTSVIFQQILSVARVMSE